MKPQFDRDHLGALIPALACSCLLGIGMPAGAQSGPEQSEELAPVVIRERGSMQESLYGDELSESIAKVETFDETLQRLFFAYREAVSSRMFAEADTLAKEIVELSISVNGLDSRKTASALTNLAVAQHGMEAYESAILNYTAAIGIIERIDDRLATELINPLRGLGAAQFATGQLGQAKETFDRAVHISHVNDGPHNPDQIELLLSLAETSLAVGDTSDAVNIQKRIFHLQARNIASDSLDIIPALQTRASWQRRMQMYEQERFTWRRIIKVIETEKGKESLDLIKPLTDLANSYLAVVYINLPAAEQIGLTSGEPYLKRAIRIAERNPDSSIQVRLSAMLELADYYVLTDRASRGHSIYRNAWGLMSQDESLLDMRARTLESGLLLRGIQAPMTVDGATVAASGSKPTGYKSGTVVFGYTATMRGRITDIRLLQANPVGLDELYKHIGRQMRMIVHRPRLVDGQPVDYNGRTFSHEFFYRDTDLPTNEASD